MQSTITAVYPISSRQFFALGLSPPPDYYFVVFETATGSWNAVIISDNPSRLLLRVLGRHNTLLSRPDGSSTLRPIIISVTRCLRSAAELFSEFHADTRLTISCSSERYTLVSLWQTSYPENLRKPCGSRALEYA